MLQFIHSSILDSQAQTVVNTVNTVGVMGKGLAHAFREKYPQMFTAYKSLCDKKQFEVGQLWLWRGSSQWVLNFPTKKHWRNPSKIEYIEQGLAKFVANYETRGIREISFPRLGCGNGGLQWEAVKPVMERYLRDLPIQIYIHDFDMNIGAPEHKLELMGKPYLRNFDTFLEDLQVICQESRGKFSTIETQESFIAEFSSEGDVNFSIDEFTKLVVSQEEIYEAWFMLTNGPLNEARLVGGARIASAYLLGLLGSLPYTRAVRLIDRDDRKSIAIELSDDLSAEENLISAE